MNFRNLISLLLIPPAFVVNAQSLTDYYRIAAENNPGLQASYKAFEASLQQVKQVHALPDPTLSFGYFISSIETRVGPQKARLSLTQRFPWFGTLEARGDAASLAAEARYAAFLDARNLLFFKVAQAYYPLFELEQWKRIERENIAILESYKTISIKKFEQGNGTMVDVLRVDLMLKDASTNLQILRDKESPWISRFNALLNREQTTPVALDSLEPIEHLPANYRMDSLINANPALKELDMQMEASSARERIAELQGYPSFGIGLDYAIVGNRTDFAPGTEAPGDNGKNALMPMVSVSIPIFGGKYKASAEESRLMRESYALQKEELINRLVSEYDRAFFEVQQQRHLMDLYEQQIDESEQALNLLLTAYGNSGKDFEEVLRMEQQLLKYQKMQASAAVRYNIAVARLHYITGADMLDDMRMR